MITVEELIVQSLYHRLVLITVRRTPNSNENGTEDSNCNETKGEQSTSTVSEVVPLAAGQNSTAEPQGLGYLYLGSLNALSHSDRRSDPVSTDARVLERDSEPVATITLNECSSTSEALIRSLGTEEISIKSKVCAVLDTKDIKVIQRLLKTSEVQTDFEPMWSVERNLFYPSNNCGDLSALQSPALSLCSGPLIDLRNCDQFSVIHLEDLQDPTSKSIVMVNSNEIERKHDALCIEDKDSEDLNSKVDSIVSSSTPVHKFYANSERLNSRGALFVEDSEGHLKREFFPNSIVAAHLKDRSLEVDSGIWDMMQALDSGGSTQILPEAEPGHSFQLDNQKQRATNENCFDNSSSDLQGTYRMFTLSDQAKESSVNALKEVNSGLYEGGGDNSELSSAKGFINESGGGLSDALKPAAAVNFVVHRVESEMGRQETKDDRTSSDKPSKRDKNVKRRDRAGSMRNSDRLYRRPRSLKARKITKGVCQTCHKCRSGGKEVEINKPEFEESQEGRQRVDDDLVRPCDLQSPTFNSSEVRGHQCTCPVAEHRMERFPDDDDPEPEQEHYKDVIKVTSLAMNNSGFSTGSSQNLLDLGKQFYPWEIVVPPRKSQSERSSPMSSLSDLRILDHPKQAFEKKRFLARSANPSPTRRSLQLSSPISSIASQNSELTDTPNTPLPSDMRSARRDHGSSDWGSGQWSGGTTDSLSTITATFDASEVLQFDKFPDWMRKLRKELHTVSLSELCIPGSHIALAIERDMKTEWEFSRCNYEMAEFLCKLPNLPVFNNFRDHMKSIWKAWMPKQWLSIHDQLVAGSRYFDIRITKHNETIFGEHGLYTRQLKKYLKEVRLFMEEQPFEVIILHFQSCEYLERHDKRLLVTMLFQIFGGKIACRSYGMLPTLEWMWQMKKQLVIIFPDADLELIKNHIFGALVWSDEIVEVTTPKKQTVVQLVDHLDSVKQRLDARDGSKLFVCKAVLSPDMSTVFGKFQYRCMRELVLCEISAAVGSWLKRQDRPNVVAVDFIGIADTVRKILELNDRYVVREK